MNRQVSPAQVEVNTAVWSRGPLVSEYDNRVLSPAEVLLMARYREFLTGRVLEAGCGAGRLLGYLVQLGADAHGTDISSAMVKRCRDRFPEADVRVGDLAALDATVSGPFDAVIMAYNLLDVFDDQGRRAVLETIRGMLAPHGLLLFSSHNLAAADRLRGGADRPSRAQRSVAGGWELLHRSPLWMGRALTRLPRRRSNRRRLGSLEHRADDHAVLNDSAHDYGLLHYYISRGEQERQLSELGYELVEALELDGRPVPPGNDGLGAALYYVCRTI